MKKIWVVSLAALFLVSCIRQNVNTEAFFLESYSFDEVWEASIVAVNDIDFTIDSMDYEAGFISAESGPHIFQEGPPRLSIMIRESNGRVHVDCRFLQKDQLIDLFGIGRKTVRNFMSALNQNLSRRLGF